MWFCWHLCELGPCVSAPVIQLSEQCARCSQQVEVKRGPLASAYSYRFQCTAEQLRTQTEDVQVQTQPWEVVSRARSALKL